MAATGRAALAAAPRPCARQLSTTHHAGSCVSRYPLTKSPPARMFLKPDGLLVITLERIFNQRRCARLRYMALRTVETGTNDFVRHLLAVTARIYIVCF